MKFKETRHNFFLYAIPLRTFEEIGIMDLEAIPFELETGWKEFKFVDPSIALLVETRFTGKTFADSCSTRISTRYSGTLRNLCRLSKN